MDYGSLKAALSPTFDFGDWFKLDDDLTGFSSSKTGRPWLLLQPVSAGQPLARLLPRSQSGYEGIQHPAHPQEPPHGPCCINREGRLPALQVRSLHVRDLTNASYGCSEPDPMELRHLLRGRPR